MNPFTWQPKSFARGFVAVLLAVLLLAYITFALFGCSRAPDATPAAVLSQADVRGELAGLLPTAIVLNDDDVYAVHPSAWLEKAVYAHVAATWHHRGYVAQLNDCDDFTDDLVYLVRKRWRESAPTGAGAATVGRLDVRFPEAEKPDGIQVWHRVALMRSDRGWVVADPTAGINPRTRTLDLVPLNTYGRQARRVMLRKKGKGKGRKGC